MNTEGLKVFSKHASSPDRFCPAPPHNAPPMSPATPSSTPAMSDGQEDASLSTPYSSSGSGSPIKRGNAYTVYPEARLGDCPSSATVLASGKAYHLPPPPTDPTTAVTLPAVPLPSAGGERPSTSKSAAGDSNAHERRDWSGGRSDRASGSSLVRGGVEAPGLPAETSPYSGRLERSLSQNMGAMGGVFGTLVMGDATAVRRPGAVARGGRVESLERTGSGGAMLRAAPSRRHVEGMNGRGGGDSTHVAIDIAELEMKSNKQKAGIVEVATEFPGLNLKPIRTRPPADKPPTVHIPRAQAGTVGQPSLTPEAYNSLHPVSCLRGGWQQVMAGLGAVVGALFSRFMYIVNGN